MTVEWLVVFTTTENGGLKLELELNDIEVEAEGENEEESLPPINHSLNPKFRSNPVTPNPAKSDSLTTEQPNEISPEAHKIPSTSTSTRPTRTRFPSRYVCNLRAGTGYTSSRDKIPRGVLDPTNLLNKALLMEATIAKAEGIEPRSVMEAKRLKDWLRWEKAIQEELENLAEHRTYEIIKTLKDTKVVGCKWVFKVKKDKKGKK